MPQTILSHHEITALSRRLVKALKIECIGCYRRAAAAEATGRFHKPGRERQHARRLERLIAEAEGLLQ